MDTIERDYKTLLLPDHEPPCLSLYQPTQRSFPQREQNQVLFRNLVKELEMSLAQKYGWRETDPILNRFHDLAADNDFWSHPLDGLAVFANRESFRPYWLQRPVKELAVAAESFHTKPLLRILQSADRYHILGLSREEARLFEGNRYVLDEVTLPPGFPARASDVVGADDGLPERRSRVYGGQGGPGQAARHGTDVRQEVIENDTERFFRAVDKAVIEHFSPPNGAPLLLAALPEHHHLFREVSRNRNLLPNAIGVNPDAISPEELRERAWELVLPLYLERLQSHLDRFGASRDAGRSGTDLAEIAMAAAASRIDTLLIDADKVVPGRFDPATGKIEFAPLDNPGIDDLLDDLGEQAIRTGAEVVIVPAERMPSDTGAAAIYRY